MLWILDHPASLLSTCAVTFALRLCERMKLPKLIVCAVLFAYQCGKRAVHRNNRQVRFYYTVQVDAKKKQTMPLKLKLTDEQKTTVTLNPATPKGKKVSVQNPVWSVVDGDCAITPAPDGLSAVITSGDKPGVTNIQIAADADLGDGVDTITDTIEVTVVDPEASTLGLAAGTPEDK